MLPNGVSMMVAGNVFWNSVFSWYLLGYRLIAIILFQTSSKYCFWTMSHLLLEIIYSFVIICSSIWWKYGRRAGLVTYFSGCSNIMEQESSRWSYRLCYPDHFQIIVSRLDLIFNSLVLTPFLHFFLFKNLRGNCFPWTLRSWDWTENFKYNISTLLIKKAFLFCPLMMTYPGNHHRYSIR